MKDSVYYIEEDDTIVVADYKEDTLQVIGVFASHEDSLDKAINSMLNYSVLNHTSLKDEIKKVKLFFTPKNTNSYEMKPLEREDTLFVLGKDKNLLEDNKFMFQKLSHT
jgi:hypothetical protein